MLHQRVMSSFPTGRMVGKVGSEIPVNAANPALKQRQREKPFVKRTTANPADQPGRTRQGKADCQGISRWRSRDADAPAALIRGMGPSGGCPMTDAPDHPSSEHLDPTAAEAKERATQERRAAEQQAFAEKLAKRSPPDQVERAEIEKATKRTAAEIQHVAEKCSALA